MKRLDFRLQGLVIEIIEPVEGNFRLVLLTTNSSVTKTDRAFNGAPALLNSLTPDFLHVRDGVAAAANAL